VPCALRFERALPERRHLDVTHDPLEPQQQPIVDQARVIDTIVINEHDRRDRAEFHQLRPVAIVAREARGFERQHRACGARADGRQHA
jgi:hypothetical protein